MQHISPHEKALQRETLAAEYARMSEEWADLQELRNIFWPDIRENVKSDKAADTQWERTENGKKQMRLKMRMKANIQQQNALSTSIRVAENEARGIY